MDDHSLAMEFNNLGVLLLHGGNRKESVCLFKGASQLVTYTLSEEKEGGKSIQTALSDPRIFQAYIIYKSFDDPAALSSSNSLNLFHSPQSAVNDSTSFVCRHAISLQDGELPVDRTQRLSLICSVLVYNIGLVYHLGACTSIMETNGPRALTLYEMAFTLLVGHGQDSLKTLVACRLAMYCLNNMASLSDDLAQWEMSAACLNQLSAIATQVTATRGVDSFLLEECQSFLLNTMVLQPTTLASAA